MTNPGDPTFGGFQQFLGVLGIPDTAAPQPPDVEQWSYSFAYDWTYKGLCVVPNPSMGWTMFAMAVYNLGADKLINWAQDAPDAPIYKDGLPYWAWLRKQYGVLNFVPGVVQSTSDEGTSVSYLVPEAFQNLMIADLGNLKTPYGRAYLGIAQSWGSLWGLS